MQPYPSLADRQIPLARRYTLEYASSIYRLRHPPDGPLDLPNALIAGYLRAFASFNGANSNDNNPRISYNTRVELVEKRFNEQGEEAGWTLTLKTLTQAGFDSYKAVWTKQVSFNDLILNGCLQHPQDFDAVVIATGRFNAPNIPGIPGLVEWDKAFPGAIIHSRQYRRSATYTNKTVLVVGASVRPLSPLDVSIDLLTSVF